MRAVLDTNILVSAFLFGGRPLEIIELAEAGKIEVVSSEEALSELLDVLSRPAFASRFRSLGFTALDVLVRCRELAATAEPGDSPGICSDPADDRFIATAVAANADLIVSGDSHLLACSDHSPVPVVSAAEFLLLIAETSEPQEDFAPQ